MTVFVHRNSRCAFPSALCGALFLAAMGEQHHCDLAAERCRAPMPHVEYSEYTLPASTTATATTWIASEVSSVGPPGAA